MADVSYLKGRYYSSYWEEERKADFLRINITETIGKNIREILAGKEFTTFGVPYYSWISLSAKYFGGKNRPNKWDNLDVYIIGPEISSNEIIHILYPSNHNPIVIKYEDLLWHLKKEFPNCPSYDWEIDSFLEKKLEEIEEAERQAKRKARGIAEKDFLETLPKASLNEDSLIIESFHVIGKIPEFNWPTQEGIKKIVTQKDIYNAINEKGGCTVSKATGNITCVVYGADVTITKFKGFKEGVKFIDIESFYKWLVNTRTVDRECRIFSSMFQSSKDDSLRSYQQSAKDKIFLMWCKYRNILLQMPTGTGKTILFTSIIKDLTSHKNTKILILAHRKELIEQIDEHLNKYEITHGLVVNGRKRDLTLPVQVASIQTITHKLNESILDEINPSFIIIDEAHHSLAKTYASFWKRCTKSWKLGVTATPCRLNNAAFKYQFSDILVTSPIKEFIDNGFLSDYDFYTDNPYHELTKTIESIKEKSTTGDYKVKTLIEKLNVERHIKQLVLCYLKYAKNLKGIVYAISIEHAHNICSAYQEIGVKAEFIDSNTPKSERTEIVQRFRNNEIQIMVNVDIFSEGFDCPDVEFIQMARPTWSLSLYLQQVGRGLRKTDNNKKTIILDNSNMFEHFGLPSEKWNWVNHFLGDYRIQSIYQNYRTENAKFLRQMCKDNDELMFKITSSQDFSKRPEILKEHNSKIASLKKFIGLNDKKEEQKKPDGSNINALTTLSGSGVAAYNVPTQERAKPVAQRSREEEKKDKELPVKTPISDVRKSAIDLEIELDKKLKAQEEAEILSQAYDAFDDSPSSTLQNNDTSTSDGTKQNAFGLTESSDPLTYKDIPFTSNVDLMLLCKKNVALRGFSIEKRNRIKERLEKYGCKVITAISYSVTVVICSNNMSQSDLTVIKNNLKNRTDLIFVRYESVRDLISGLPLDYPSTQNISTNVHKPKRHYKMVGESKPKKDEIEEPKTHWFAYVLAACALIALAVLLFASLGAAVFFLPLLAGAFIKKR